MAIELNAQKPAGDGGDFVKLKAGESIIGMFRPGFHEGKRLNTFKKDGSSQWRFQAPFVVWDDGEGKFVAKVFEGAWGTYEALQAIQSSGFELDLTRVSVGRTGEGKDTRYHLMPTPQQPTKEDLEAVAKVELPKLPIGEGWLDAQGNEIKQEGSDHPYAPGGQGNPNA
jgi:hypothetical protein